jgi:hypothetical protein
LVYSEKGKKEKEERPHPGSLKTDLLLTKSGLWGVYAEDEDARSSSVIICGEAGLLTSKTGAAVSSSASGEE